MRTIYLGADHAGYRLKEVIKAHLQKKGVRVTDYGTTSTKAVDYPLYARKVAHAVLQKGGSALGILVCGSGAGVAMVANKVSGIRAAQVWDVFTAKKARSDDNAHIATLAGKVTKKQEALRIVDAFLRTPFSGAVRHQRRLQQVRAIEKEK